MQGVRGVALGCGSSSDVTFINVLMNKSRVILCFLKRNVCVYVLDCDRGLGDDSRLAAQQALCTKDNAVRGRGGGWTMVKVFRWRTAERAGRGGSEWVTGTRFDFWILHKVGRGGKGALELKLDQGEQALPVRVHPSIFTLLGTTMQQPGTGH